MFESNESAEVIASGTQFVWLVANSVASREWTCLSRDSSIGCWKTRGNAGSL